MSKFKIKYNHEHQGAWVLEGDLNDLQNDVDTLKTDTTNKKQDKQIKANADAVKDLQATTNDLSSKVDKLTKNPTSSDSSNPYPTKLSIVNHTLTVTQSDAKKNLSVDLPYDNYLNLVNNNYKLEESQVSPITGLGTQVLVSANSGLLYMAGDWDSKSTDAGAVETQLKQFRYFFDPKAEDDYTERALGTFNIETGEYNELTKIDSSDLLDSYGMPTYVIENDNGNSYTVTTYAPRNVELKQVGAVNLNDSLRLESFILYNLMPVDGLSRKYEGVKNLVAGQQTSLVDELTKSYMRNGDLYLPLIKGALRPQYKIEKLEAPSIKLNNPIEGYEIKKYQVTRLTIGNM